MTAVNNNHSAESAEALLLRRLIFAEKVIQVLLNQSARSPARIKDLLERQLAQLGELVLAIPVENLALFDYWEGRVIALWKAYTLPGSVKVDLCRSSALEVDDDYVDDGLKQQQPLETSSSTKKKEGSEVLKNKQDSVLLVDPVSTVKNLASTSVNGEPKSTIPHTAAATASFEENHQPQLCNGKTVSGTQPSVPSLITSRNGSLSGDQTNGLGQSNLPEEAEEEKDPSEDVFWNSWLREQKPAKPLTTTTTTTTTATVISNGNCSGRTSSHSNYSETAAIFPPKHQTVLIPSLPKTNGFVDISPPSLSHGGDTVASTSDNTIFYGNSSVVAAPASQLPLPPPPPLPQVIQETVSNQKANPVQATPPKQIDYDFDDWAAPPS